MNTIKSKSLMKYLRIRIANHYDIANSTTASEETRAKSAAIFKELNDVRIVAAECIKEGEWLAKRGGK